MWTYGGLGEYGAIGVAMFLSFLGTGCKTSEPSVPYSEHTRITVKMTIGSIEDVDRFARIRSSLRHKRYTEAEELVTERLRLAEERMKESIPLIEDYIKETETVPPELYQLHKQLLQLRETVKDELAQPVLSTPSQ